MSEKSSLNIFSKNPFNKEIFSYTLLEANRKRDGLVLATMILAIATIALVIFLGIQTHTLINQTEILRDEFEASQRPWIGSYDLVDDGFTLQNGIFVSNEDYNKMSKEEKLQLSLIAKNLNLQLKNHGKLPAKNAVLHLKILQQELDESPPTSEIFKQFEEEGPSNIIMPGEIINHRFTIPYDYFAKNIFVAYEMKYDYLENKSGFYQVIFQVKPIPGTFKTPVIYSDAG